MPKIRVISIAKAEEALKGLKEALPPTYRGALEVEEWDDIMQVLDNHYKNTLRDARNSKETT